MLFLDSCDVLEFHPYDARIEGKKHINALNIARIEESCRGKDTICFAVISDSQRWYDDTHDAVRSINANPKVQFVLHCGDLADFGMTREFEWMRDELEGLRVPYTATIGNHDCLGSGSDVFRIMFGDPNYAFCAGRVAFVGLNTVAFEYDYSEAVPDFAFIRRTGAALPDSITRTVVSMHAAPFSDQFNNNVADFFHEEIKKFPGLAFAVYGHTHSTSADDLFDDGTIYYQCDCAKHRKYLIFTVTDNSYTYEVIDY